MKSSAKSPPSPDTPVNPLERHLGYWLRYVSNHVSHAFGERLGGLGVTTAEWVILRRAYDHEATSVSDLSTMTGITRGAVSKLVDRLAGKQLLSKVEMSADKRRQKIKLTARGRQMVPRLAKIADANDRFFFAHFSTKDRQRLILVMKQLVKMHHMGRTPLE